MTKCPKMKYPAEALALALVLFSAGMREAMLVGIAMIFGDVLLYVIRENCAEANRQTFGGAAVGIITAAMALMFSMSGTGMTVKEMIGFAAIAVLIVKHHDGMEGEIDYNNVLVTDSILYGAYVAFALCREYLASGKIFECSIAKYGFMSHAFGKPMFALIGAGIFMAVFALITKCEYSEEAALWVCVPAIVLEAPFVIKGVPAPCGMAAGIAVSLAVYLVFRGKLALSDTPAARRGLPVELIVLGMMYMICTVL